MSGPGASAVFLDRDGTLIEDVGYPRDPALVKLIDGAVPALARLRDAGFLLVVVSNQSGVGRGLVEPADAHAVHERFVLELEREGIALDGSKYCPHAPDAGCECRKPAPGMLIEAAGELGVNLETSYMVGDKPSDVEAGCRAGCRTVLLAPGAGNDPEADHVASSWEDAVGYILGSAGTA